MDITRRTALGATAAAFASAWGVPSSPAQAGGRLYGRADVVRAQNALIGFSNIDQRHGGGTGVWPITDYFNVAVTPSLRGRFANESVRREMVSAAGEAAYLAGWMSFDDGQHLAAKRFYAAAVELADEADDQALVGHTLRAMAHQALELDQHRDARHYAEASMGAPYRSACPRERALLGVVYARVLATSGQSHAASAALLQAEGDLGRATGAGDEPARVAFFSEASLAHETGRALYALGDLGSAEAALDHSARVRRRLFARTHAVTLGYLGEIQAADGRLYEACGTWAKALDAMTGVRSARTRATAMTIRRCLQSPSSMDPTITDIDRRAAVHLAGR